MATIQADLKQNGELLHAGILVTLEGERGDTGTFDIPDELVVHAGEIYELWLADGRRETVYVRHVVDFSHAEFVPVPQEG